MPNIEELRWLLLDEGHQQRNLDLDAPNAAPLASAKDELTDRKPKEKIRSLRAVRILTERAGG